MHPSAMDLGARFFASYFERNHAGLVLDIGAQDVNGSLRQVAPAGMRYVGVDFVPGNGVDVVLDDPYSLPFESGSADAIVCSSVFEHSEFFWLLYLEMLRILKPSGLIYLNAPSNGYVHRYPVDCWRFFPDAGLALVNWGRRNGHSVALLESFIAGKQAVSVDSDAWNDFVAVFVKDADRIEDHPRQIIDSFTDYTNGHHWREPGTERKPQSLSDDLLRIKAAQDLWQSELQQRQGLERELAALKDQLGTTSNLLAEARSKVEETTRQAVLTAEALTRSENDLRATRASRSWRYTAWMRGVGTLLRKPGD